MNRMGNLELLLPAENQEKADTIFEEWLPTREPNFRARHLIPQDHTLWRFDQFEGFVEVREELIRQRLRTIFALPAREGIALSTYSLTNMIADRQPFLCVHSPRVEKVDTSRRATR